MLVLGLGCAATAWGATIASTFQDFKLPGTQPLTVNDNFLPPSACTPCHSGYGQPSVEPYRNWQGSMMGQAGRDPLMWAAVAIANQDADHSGETCLRCHLPKGWLEGRSVPADGTAMTADDRHGVQCSVCHRLVDPFADAENPVEDTAILAALTDPVTTLGSAQMVADPDDRRRGPFDVVADLGSNPHAPNGTLVSPFHQSSDLCGTCHDVANPLYTRNGMGDYDLNTLDQPGDPALGFPEQQTYSEWSASEFASTGVFAPQFGGNKDVVSTCQDCHMPDVSGKDAQFGVTRDDVPRHSFLGGNTFAPAIIPAHPVFGAEVDAALLAEPVEKNTDMLRKAATVSAELSAGNLTVRVTNDAGHKLPTGYPEGRRMWLHVRAFDAARQVVFESGRYVFETATLVGYEALPMDADYDPNLHVWETVQGISSDVALALGVASGPSFHLVLNNVREFDNRIPPRGFSNASFEVFDGEPVGQAYPDGQHWDDVSYPVGADAVQAEVTLYYQTASREYVEFLRDENVTNAAGPILFDLWDDNGQSVPVEMARAFVETDAGVLAGCRKSVAKGVSRYAKTYAKEWGRCYATKASGLPCDGASRDARIAAAGEKLRLGIGGAKDRSCAAASLTPISIGHGSVCPVPCPATTLFDLDDLATCGVCIAEALGDASLEAAYGEVPPALPPTAPPGAPGKCLKSAAKAATSLAAGWSGALVRCERDNDSGKNNPAEDCSTDPDGRVAKAKDKSARRIAKCGDFSGLTGCLATGDPGMAETCLEAEVGAVAPGFAAVGYP